MTPQEAANKYYWCKYDDKTNTVELFLDNYMLSASRLCEAKFYMEHLLWLKPRMNNAVSTNPNKVLRKPWFFDFGEFIHYCLEIFYNHYKKHNTPPEVEKWLEKCKHRWEKMQMDDYARSIVQADVKKYEEVKGWEGVAGLLIQYYAFYIDLRVRVIDTEISFGHNREVHIGTFYLPVKVRHKVITGRMTRWITTEITTVKCYLVGRIDLMIDNGYLIGPVDHKTTHRFDGFEHREFNPHDGITGYILAIDEIFGRYKDKLPASLKHCRNGWIYHISATMPPSPNEKSRDKGKTQEPRFKTTPIGKNDVQLEDYKTRQLSSYKRIAELLFTNKTPEWNTLACNNIFFRECEYKPIHEQPSTEWAQIITNHYDVTKPWDTRDYNHGNNKDSDKISNNTQAQVLVDKV